ncbi:MAG: hypothetical protein M0Z96_04395 [Actinomycetota bacterium]|nr:hypothetical protein [Actinomycetota bacterium]
MSQPRFVTSPKHEQALGLVELPVSTSWTQPRTGSVTPTDRTKRRLLGTPGPGQGYALRLIKEKSAKIVLTEGEEHEDVETGLSAIIGKRAASFGRSPISYDVDFFVKLFGFDGAADASLVEFRRMFFKGAGHSYVVQRQLADAIPESTLKLTLDALSSVQQWRQLFRI